MNISHFYRFMSAVDDDLLEEAKRPDRKVTLWQKLLPPVAACLCMAVGLLAWQMRESPAQPAAPSSQTAEPFLYQSTEQEISGLGYELPLPEDASSIAYFLVKNEAETSVPMVQADYWRGGQAFTIRALKTEEPQDISGLHETWEQDLNWSVGSLSMQLRQSSGEAAWVGWYSDNTQWCLSGDADSRSLLYSAQDILDALGYNLTKAPVGASQVLYNVLELDDLVVGETSFLWNDVSCAFRMAETWDVSEDFTDISGFGDTFAYRQETAVQWCPARLSWDEGGAGKLVWFDVVPGLLYSLTVETGASETVLLELAEQLYLPAQGDV